MKTYLLAKKEAKNALKLLKGHNKGCNDTNFFSNQYDSDIWINRVFADGV